MRRSRFALLLLLPLLFTACPALTSTSAPDALEIRGGTSFGMCLGYCITELTLTESEIRFVRTARDGQQPPQTHTRPMPAEVWSRLTTAVDPDELATVAETHGCPDCADGGAEWIAVRADGLDRRITFEHGNPPAELAQLAAQIREIRESFPTD